MIYKNPFFFLVCISLFSCKSKQNNLVPTTYIDGVVLSIVDKKLPFTSTQEILNNFLETEQVGLPRPENIIDYEVIKEQTFKNHFLSYNNILLVRKKEGNSSLTITKDKWANNQNVLSLYIENTDSLIVFIKERGNEINDFFHGKEIKKIMTRHAKFGNKNAQDSLKAYLGISLYLPDESFIATVDSSIFWLRKEQEKLKGSTAHQVSQGILVYKDRYNSPLQIDTSIIINTLRNLLAQYIPGPNQGSFMSISDKYILPSHHIKTTNGLYSVETRGLWRVENGLNMGGAFINYTVINEEAKEIIFLYSYTYAPELDKRSLVNELEASIKSYYVLNK